MLDHKRRLKWSQLPLVLFDEDLIPSKDKTGLSGIFRHFYHLRVCFSATIVVL